MYVCMYVCVYQGIPANGAWTLTSCNKIMSCVEMKFYNAVFNSFRFRSLFQDDCDLNCIHLTFTDFDFICKSVFDM